MKYFIFLTVLLSGCATLQDRAVVGQASDSITTAIAIHRGFVESNPLIANNLPLVLVAKPILAYSTKYLAPDDCVTAKRALGGWGAFGGAWNFVVLASGQLPVKLALAVIAGYFGQDEAAAANACKAQQEN